MRKDRLPGSRDLNKPLGRIVEKQSLVCLERCITYVCNEGNLTRVGEGESLIYRIIEHAVAIGDGFTRADNYANVAASFRNEPLCATI